MITETTMIIETTNKVVGTIAVMKNIIIVGKTNIGQEFRTSHIKQSNNGILNLPAIIIIE